MVTVAGDCRVNKSDENKWLDWKGTEKGDEWSWGIEEAGGGIKQAQVDSHWDKFNRGHKTEE